jgi:hypothetical protein
MLLIINLHKIAGYGDTNKNINGIFNPCANALHLWRAIGF